MASTTKPKGPSPEPARPFEPKSKASSSKAAVTPETARPTAMRETIESIVVAFILAFMFKTFEAEAFVIPTGSMAPTLYGRNKAATCPKCGTEFTIGASDEVETETDYVIPGARIDSAICPNCRYRLKKEDIYDVPVFKGDGILVNKFSFEIRDPQRWQVVVFKYPEEPKTNYIKRCVGLPNETICIRQGNLYGKNEEGAWEILRKDDPNKQRVLQMNVYDNDHPERRPLERRLARTLGGGQTGGRRQRHRRLDARYAGLGARRADPRASFDARPRGQRVPVVPLSTLRSDGGDLGAGRGGSAFGDTAGAVDHRLLRL